jgi:uncharacterized RDD family membrane protein YckC
MAKFVPDDVPAWKIELTEKLAASRARRSSTQAAGRTHAAGRTGHPLLPLEQGSAESGDAGRAGVAAAVAARYAARPSYRETLEREAQEAALAAEQALLDAQAAQQAVRQRMEAARAAEAAAAEARAAEEDDTAAGPSAQAEPEAVRVHYEVDERTRRQMEAYEAQRTADAPRSAQPAPPRQQQFNDSCSDPFEEEIIAPAIPLAANLIEFPRELVAPRKARPRLAEGPLRDAEEPETQLRIFEVEPERDRRPPTARGSGLDWSEIRLDSQRPSPPPAPRSRHASPEAPPPTPAPLADRAMAALVDAALSFAGFLVFVFVFTASTAHPPAGKPALAAAAAALLAVSIGYQWLFFRFAEGTPGMLYARVALCTLDDNNPSRRAMCRRVGALLLSALPLGLGLLWALFDEDSLGWHDRISGTYQRSYR